jgi:RNA polymerase sigma-70 factor, ECF subfamily
MSEPSGGPDPSTTDTLFPLVYDELKRLARQQLRARGGGDTPLRTTELVHEAYLKLGHDAAWESRAHFFGTAARAMRQVLVDFARRRGAVKRGGAWRAVSLDDDTQAALDVELDDLVALDGALQALDRVSPRLRRLVELRFFAGLPSDEVGALLGVSGRTVERDWLKARLFLLERLNGR